MEHLTLLLFQQMEQICFIIGTATQMLPPQEEHLLEQIPIVILLRLKQPEHFIIIVL